MLTLIEASPVLACGATVLVLLALRAALIVLFRRTPRPGSRY